jgi:hypothetical protein
VGNGVEVGVLTTAATAAESRLATVGVGVTTPAVLEIVEVGMSVEVAPELSAAEPQPVSKKSKLTAKKIVFNDTESMSKVV